MFTARTPSNFPGVVFDPSKTDVLFAEDLQNVLDTLYDLTDTNDMKPLFAPQAVDLDLVGPIVLGAVPPGKKMYITGMLLQAGAVLNSSDRPSFSIASGYGDVILGASDYTGPLAPDICYLVDVGTTTYHPVLAADTLRVVNDVPGTGGDHVVTISLLGYTIDA